MVYKILCWVNISKFYVAKIKYPCMAQTTTTNISFNSQDKTWSGCYVYFTKHTAWQERTASQNWNVCVSNSKIPGFWSATQFLRKNNYYCHPNWCYQWRGVGGEGQMFCFALFFNLTIRVGYFCGYTWGSPPAFYGCAVFYYVKAPYSVISYHGVMWKVLELDSYLIPSTQKWMPKCWRLGGKKS